MGKWIATWNGHTIVAERKIGFGHLVLSADGRVIGEGHGVFTGEVRGEVRNSDGSTSVIVAKFRQSHWGTLKCHIFADDRIVGGDSL